MQPNILVILADDLGSEQLEMYDVRNCGLHDFTGNTNHIYPNTPTMDSIAEAGVRFKWAFTTPTCTPTRAQLMTGRYPHRTMIGGIINTRGRMIVNSCSYLEQLDLPLDELTLPEILEEAGYSTALIGKWHLARDESNRFGVPSAFAPVTNLNCTVAPGCPCPPANPLLAGAPPNVPGRAHPALTGWSFFSGIMHNPNNAPAPNNSIFPAAMCQGNPLPSDCPGNNYYGWIHVESVPSPISGRDDAIWASEVIADDSEPLSDAAFITSVQRQHLEGWLQTAEQPFCAIWSASAPHGPYDQSPPSTLMPNGSSVPCVLDNDLNGQFYLRFLQLIESLDYEIGELRDAMLTLPGMTGPESNMWDDTVVIVMSDNGTPTNVQANNAVDCVVPPPNVDMIAPYSANLLGPLENRRFKGSPFLTGTHIPLVVSGPGVTNAPTCVVGTCGIADPPTVAGRIESTAVVEMVDVFATILDLASATLPGNVDGESFRPALLGNPVTIDPVAMSLKYDPNGDFRCAVQHDVGLTARISGAFSGPPSISLAGDEVYRLIRRVDTTDLCNPVLERLYRVEALSMGMNCPDDIRELTDLSTNSAFDDVETLLKQELDAILGTTCSCWPSATCQCPSTPTPCPTCPSHQDL